jgi:dTDP-4-dehydrorhamnose 3,5-epimerase-like enzyme
MGFHSDDRGTIEDLLEGPIDSVTEIFTRQGAVRGNHYHKETTQWTYVVSGCLRICRCDGGVIVEVIVGADEMVKDDPGISHAWKAIEDTVCLVFTRGPRSGEGYEDDTYRLEEPLLS